MSLCRYDVSRWVRRWAICLALGLPHIVQADVASRVEMAFTRWAAQAGAGAAVLVLGKDGNTLGQVAIGAMDVAAPVELASLSKAITAACAAHLMTQGVWSAQTTAREVLGLGDDTLTLGALLTHGAGVLPDQTQGITGYWERMQSGQGAGAARCDGNARRVRQVTLPTTTRITPSSAV